MSSYDFARSIARITALAVGLGLAGCSIHPLYSSLDNHLQQELQAVAIDPIPDRLGHYLGNELIFAFNGTGSSVPPKYRLLVTAGESLQSPLTDPFQSRATSATVRVDANFRLIPVGGGAPITSGVATSLATYDRSEQRFANLRAARDAEIRDAKALADQIKTRVAAALASRQP